MKTKAANVDVLLAPVAEAFAGDQEVRSAKMFGSSGLKVRGKVFAMVVKEKLVVKLTRERVDDLVASGAGEHFDPGHGRLMKEWVAVSASRKSRWVDLAKEARRFVSAGEKV